MPIILWALIGVIVVAVSAALYALQAGRIRRELVLRLDGNAGVASAPITILRGTDEGWVTRLGRWLRENAPSSWSNAGAAAPLLVQAGFEGDFAPLFYTTIRVTTAVLLPLTAFVLGPQSNFRNLMMLVILAGAAGVIGPKAVLDRLGHQAARQGPKGDPGFARLAGRLRRGWGWAGLRDAACGARHGVPAPGSVGRVPGRQPDDQCRHFA